jgi:DNA helicase II / ATP-dependent DNA helicase PcrA
MLKLLMASSITVEMVGDVRQAILATNERELKNKVFMYMGIWNWFRAEQRAVRLSITQRADTWRCRPEIAALADSLFDATWGFESTVSRNRRRTPHDGVFFVREADVDAYMASFQPLALRHASSSAKALDHLPFITFGEAKGLAREHVIIYPTDPIKKFMKSGFALNEKQAARFYVAVTRAEQSVAVILDERRSAAVPLWSPER